MGKEMLKEIEKWAKTYEFSFQFWGETRCNVWIYKGDVELYSNGGFDTPEETIKCALDYIYRINRVPIKNRITNGSTN